MDSSASVSSELHAGGVGLVEARLRGSSSELHAGGMMLVEARLRGGAPWGFTLQGGLEHGEPLIISKVEEGGKVCSLQHPLLAGDQLLLINQVELSGSRQEAVSLVKGSHRTLQLTVCREGAPLSSLEDWDSAPAPHFIASPPAPAPPPPPPAQHTDQAATSAVQLCTNTRHSEPTSRPHSWHATKLGGGGLHPSQLEELCPGGLDALHTPWHQHHHASVSTTDLSAGWDSGFSYLRRSPDQYSSRESLDSLDPPPPPQSRAGPRDPPLDPHDHREHQPVPTHPSTRSSHSMDLLHSKRDSAYSSFSTSSSIPDYLASAPSLSSERCYSLESVSPRGREEECPHGHAGFMRSELTSAASLGNSLSQERGVAKRESGGGVFYHGNCSSGSSGGIHGSKRHSVGPIWGPTAGPSPSDPLKEVPAPPHRSDSYRATRTHERPSSWSSLEHGRSLRSLHKGSWHHSSGSVASAKGSYSADVQLHTVVEKSPESSPTPRPRQAGTLPGTPSTSPEPLRYSQGPPAAGARDPLHQQGRGARGGGEEEEKGWRGGENGLQSSLGPAAPLHLSPSSSSSSSSSSCPLRRTPQETDRAEDHPPVSPRVAKGQAPARPPHTPSYLQPSAQPPPPWDQQETPLTRLEMALAEVQRCAGTDSVLTPASSHCGGSKANSGGSHANSGGSKANSGGSHANSGGSQANSGGNQDSGLSLSVLEKVCRFERREHGVKQRSLSSRSCSLQFKNDPGQSGKSSPCGAEDLRNMLERSGSKAHRTMSYRGRSSDPPPHRGQADPSSFLLRSRSTFHLREPPPEESLQPLCAAGQPPHTLPHAFSSSYRDSLKDAQSKVLGSTSFRRRDLSSSLLPPPPPAAFLQPGSSSSSSGLLSPTSYLSLEKRGPKTKPKPQRPVLTSSCSPPLASPHTPRERHTVSPPARPAAGPPLLGRVCGRKRLSVQQKKRSYSEPESLHEVGVSDPETSALFRRGPGESSVADRRRLFEGAPGGSLCGDGSRPQSTGPRPQSAGSRPPALRQAQQDALAQYIQRKRNERREQDRPQRPQSYLHPDPERRTETSSLSSASSLLSLQESCPDWSLVPGEGWLGAHLGPGAQSSLRSTRPPSSGTEPASPSPLQVGGHCLTQAPASPPQAPPLDQGLSRQVHEALQRARSSMGSTEDLPDERETGDQLHRCFSTPQQDAREVSMTTLPTAEALQQPDRPMTTQTPEGHAPSSDPAHHHYQIDVSPGISAFAAPQGETESHPPVTRRERPHISSPLAASVGLPSPLPHPTSPSPRPASPLYHPVTSAPRLLNTVGDGVTEEIMWLGATGFHGDHPSTSASVSPSPPPIACSVPGEIISQEAPDSLGLKYQPLPRREPSAQELRVQVLLGQLVSREPSLAPLLDTVGTERTIELMEEVFHGSASAGRSPWQRKDGSLWGEHRSQDGGSPGGLETDLDEEEKDLNVTKVALCAALRSSVEALQEEKEVLQEELRQHREQGAGLEVLVQDRCRPNEREKYRVFTGDLQKVVNLLLSLSGRLARTEVTLHHLEDRQEDDTGERASLLLKRSQLLSQREDARELKEHLERRQRVVRSLLSARLGPAQLLLYGRLVSATPSLLIRQRRLDDLIRQGEEHLVLIKETLPLHLAGDPDTSRGYQLSSSPAPFPSLATPQGHAHTARGTAMTSL